MVQVLISFKHHVKIIRNLQADVKTKIKFQTMTYKNENKQLHTAPSIPLQVAYHVLSEMQYMFDSEACDITECENKRRKWNFVKVIATWSWRGKSNPMSNFEKQKQN